MMSKGQPFMDVKEDGGSAPTFSETFLYPTVGKGDARFILAVADEYQHVIDALGPAAVVAILQVKAKLVARLGVGDVVREQLADARDDVDLMREKQSPVEVRLDDEAAHACWQMLHGEYRRYFDPENGMDKDALRAYHALTDGLGEWEQAERQKERDRLPEKLKKQEERQAALADRQERRAATRAAIEAARSKFEAMVGDTELPEHVREEAAAHLEAMDDADWRR